MAATKPASIDPRILVPPPARLTRQHITRERLLARIDELLDIGAVLSLTAPAASGKTSLLLGWQQQRPHRRIVYLAIDLLDNGPTWFWTRLVTGLRSVGCQVGDTVSSLLGDEDELPHDASLAGALRADLAAVEPTVLVLDDLQNVTAPPVGRLLDQLLLNLPDNLRVILSGRSEPPIHQGLLRARGRLEELPAQELRFTTDELAEFLARFDVELEPEVLQAFHERIKGWTGGAKLAATALARHGDPFRFVQGFSGWNRYVADLLQRDVLEAQEPEVQRFLLTTSILDRLDPATCDQVTRGSDSAEMLAHLDHIGMFVERSIDGPDTYVYQPLVREFLQHRFHHLDPASERDAHRAAARWYESGDHISDALHHLLAAGEGADAVHLVLRHGERYAATGRIAMLRTWLGDIPGDVLTGDLELLMGIADLCVLTGMRDEAMMWLERCRWRLSSLGDPLMDARLAVLTGRAQSAGGNLGAAIEQGSLALTLMTRSEEDDPQTVSAAHHLLGACYAVNDDVDKAARHAAAAPLDDTLYRPHSAYGAWLLYRIGDLDAAMDSADLTLHSVETPWMWSAALLARGAVHRERNRLAEAEADLVGAVKVGQEISRPLAVALAEMELARIRFAEGRPGAAYEHLTTARAYTEGRWLRARVDLLECFLWLLAGDIDRATALRMRMDDGPITSLYDSRLAVEQGNYDAARARLRTMGPRAQLRENRIWATLLEARIALHTGDPDGAVEKLRQAIDLGRNQRFIRSYAVDLPHLQQPMRQLTADTDDPYLFDLMASGVLVPRAQQRSSLVLSALTARELVVLRYLPGSLSNKEIATELHMSVNTLKTHLKNINRKLGVTSRAGAAQAAQAAGLL